MNDSNKEYNTPLTIVNAFATAFSDAFAPSAASADLPDSLSDHPLVGISSFAVEDVLRHIKRLKNKCTSGNDNIPCFLVKDCALIFAEPLQAILNLALRTCVFPDAWKVARICPIFKRGDACNVNNYRPIAIISAFAKIFESLIYEHVAFQTKSAMSFCQHGFTTRKSTITNLSTISQAIAEALDLGGQLDVIYTDFSRAFDSINHSVLLQKLSSFGFNNALLRLISSYLVNRQNYVYYNGFKSRYYVSSSGVPQGSNLGPLLFNLFVNDLIGSIRCPVLAYADDLKIYNRITTPTDADLLQQDLEFIHTWCLKNKLTLNIDKCHFVSYTRKLNKFDSKYHINNISLSSLSSVKDLGVHFDSKFTFAEHISAITISAHKMLGFIFRTCRDFTNLDAICSLFFAFIVSKLEYAAVVWYPMYDVYTSAIERIQRKFLKYLSFKMDGAYPVRGIDYSILLRRHNFISLDERRKTISAFFMDSLISSKLDAPELLSKVNFLVPRLESRSRDFIMVSTPRTNILLRAPLHHSAVNFNDLRE